MPLYEYECRKCHHRFEKIQKGSSSRPGKCPKCRSGRLEKLISAPAVHFKGTGWYVTDYARKGKADGGGKEQKEGSADSGKESAAKESPAKGSSAKESTTKAPAAKEGSGKKPGKD